MFQTEITFITSHAKKAEELSLHLNYPIVHKSLDLTEIQSLDPITVATLKAKEAFRILKRPVLVEDFSMSFTAMGRLPGPLIRWFLSEMGPEGMCRLLDNYDSRRATAQTTFAICIDGEVKIFSGILEGMITSRPRGDKGFGMDAVFIPDGSSQTWGEMGTEDQVKYSLRRIGLKKLEGYLKGL